MLWLIASLNFVVLDWLFCWCFIVLCVLRCCAFSCGYGCGVCFSIAVGFVAVHLIGCKFCWVVAVGELFGLCCISGFGFIYDLWCCASGGCGCVLWLLGLGLVVWRRCLCGLAAVCGCDLRVCRVIWVSCYCVRRCGWVLLLTVCYFDLLIRMLSCRLSVFGVCDVCWFGVCACCWL